MNKIISIWIIVFCVIFLICLIALIGAGWFFSDILYSKALNPDRPAWGKDTQVISCSENEIYLEKISLLDDDYKSEGIYGIEWESGFGILTDVLFADEIHSRRKFRLVQGTLPIPGTKTGISNIVFPKEPYQVKEIPDKELFYTSELGRFSAFYTDSKESIWIILVHGNSMLLVDTRRALLSFKNLGYPCLNISYRNDKGQPRDPSNIMQLGLTEWKDLEGAVEYAVSRGVEKVVLYGVSMGGGIVVNFMYKSALKDKVIGIILDSPVLNFGKTIDSNAKKEKIPGLGLPVPQILTDMAKFITGLRYNIDWHDLNYLKDMDSLDVPILLFHGSDDRAIPVETSDELANKRKDIIFNYVRTPGVDHIRTWNYDPVSYEQHLSDFLEYITQ